MPSWWGLIARRLGVSSPSSGSDKKRVANFLDPDTSPGNSWAQKLANKFGVLASVGSYTSRMAGTVWPGAAARNLYLQLKGGTSVFDPKVPAPSSRPPNSRSSTFVIQQRPFVTTRAVCFGNAVITSQTQSATLVVAAFTGFVDIKKPPVSDVVITVQYRPEYANHPNTTFTRVSRQGPNVAPPPQISSSAITAQQQPHHPVFGGR